MAALERWPLLREREVNAFLVAAAKIRGRGWPLLRVATKRGTTVYGNVFRNILVPSMLSILMLWKNTVYMLLLISL